MANKLYRLVHDGKEFAQLETFNRRTLRVVIVHQIQRKTVSGAVWCQELDLAIKADIRNRKAD